MTLLRTLPYNDGYFLTFMFGDGQQGQAEGVGILYSFTDRTWRY